MVGDAMTGDAMTGGTAVAVPRRFDPLGPAVRFWVAFLVPMLLSCAGFFVELGIARVPRGSARENDFTNLYGEIISVLAFVIYIALTLAYFARRPPARIRERAARANVRPRRWIGRVFRYWGVLVAVLIAFFAVQVAADELPNVKTLAPDAPGTLTGLAATDVFLSWAVLHLMYTEYYAVLYYRTGGGLDFAGEEPDYFDFAYFAFSIGMTFGTTDISVTSHRFRRAMLPHKLLSFAFNTAILALVLTILFQ